MEKIPFFNLSRQTAAIKKECMQSIEDILDQGDFIEGRAVRELEKQIGEYLGVKHVITCGNGTEALVLALKALGVGRGDEVITTPFSFIATAEAIVSAGAVPVFADIDASSFNLDAAKAEEKITDRTKAILTVHIFGLPADMDALRAVADKHNIRLIEDACQAVGSEYHGRKAGALSDAAGFSFYPTKNLGACGDGGMITTDRDDTAVICRALKTHGSGKNGAKAAAALRGETLADVPGGQSGKDALYDPYKYYNYLIGGNSRLDSLQAAVLLVKLKHLDEYNRNRAAIAKKYITGLSGLGLKLPEYAEGCCWHQFPVLTEDKEGFMQYMAEHGIGTGAFYPVPLHLQAAFAELGYKKGDLPIAERVCGQSVCLPVFPELREDEVDYIIETIRKFERKEG